MDINTNIEVCDVASVCPINPPPLPPPCEQKFSGSAFVGGNCLLYYNIHLFFDYITNSYTGMFLVVGLNLIGAAAYFLMGLSVHMNINNWCLPASLK